LHNEANNVRRITTAESRAATVSPPWFGNRAGSTERFLSNEDARMPRGADAPRSCVGVRMSAGEIAILRCTNAHQQQRLVSARRGSAIAPATPSVCCRTRMLACHGRLTHPLLIAARSFARGKPPVAMHKRTSRQERRASARRGTGNRTCNGDRFSWSGYIHHALSDGSPRLDYVSRSWCTTPVR
jgi:hypothetical protein